MKRLVIAVLLLGSGCRREGSRSPIASVGQAIFFDSTLSASGRMSCASCHSPEHAYGPPNGRAVQQGGAALATPGLRAVPSLRYTLARTPMWSHPRPTNPLEQVIETDNGPAGGFGWDGRFNTLREQAVFPMLAAMEMGGSKALVVQRIAHGSYVGEFRKVFGEGVLGNVDTAFADAMRAVERFELEDPSFHPYTSKYDRWLDGKVALTAEERRGLDLFNDGTKGNCASCHYSARGADGSHPLFTDYQFEVIGVPRNAEIPANRDGRFYDLGLCGPVRVDQAKKSYCGMFKTPTLRNVATRGVFFHNGRYHTLKDALRFYVERDTTFDDLPDSLKGNVDRKTAPFGRKAVWDDRDIDDVIAFLNTLTDAR